MSRNTVARYADMEDMSPAAPVARDRPHPAIDADAAWIDAILEADLGAPRKQRHTAKRIYDRLFSQSRSHYRFEARFRDPYSGNEKGSVENAVGFLRRNLLVPVPEVGSLDELNRLLRDGCDRVNASSRSREGAPTPDALREDLAGMLALPGVAFDAVRWTRARADRRGYVRVDGNLYCAGPAWHDRALVVGVRAASVEILADRGRRVATLRRSFGEGEVVRNPLSLIPALVARPRAFGESTIRRDMPSGLVSAIDRLVEKARDVRLDHFRETAMGL